MTKKAKPSALFGRVKERVLGVRVTEDLYQACAKAAERAGEESVAVWVRKILVRAVEEGRRA